MSLRDHELADMDTRLKKEYAEPANGYQTIAGCETAVRELTAREILTELKFKMEQEYADLDELLKALPQELPYRANRALRRLTQK